MHLQQHTRLQPCARDRVRQPDLGAEVPAEVAEHVQAVGALRRRRQAEQHPGADLPQQPLVAGRGGVVELVHDDVGEMVRRQLLGELLGIVALDRHEQVVVALGSPAADEQVAEVVVAQDGPERRQALLQ